MITLNQINAKLKDIATRHLQINSYGIGDAWEIDYGKLELYVGDSPTKITYPLMWAILQPSSLGGKIYSRKLRLAFFDLVKKDERNELEVLSDMEQVAMDVVAELNNPDNWDDFSVSGSVSFEQGTEKFDDEVSGFIVDLTLEIPFVSDRCSIPFDEECNDCLQTELEECLETELEECILLEN